MEKRQYSPKRCWENLTSICQGMRLSSAQPLSRVWLFATPWTAACQTFLFINNSRILLKLMSIEFMMPSNHLILCWSHLLPSSIFPSIRVFSGTLKGLLQHHSSKASILQCLAFFTVQLSHPYMTTGKTTALTRWTSVGKVMSLLFNMLSRLVITFTKEQASFNFMAAVTMQGFWGPKCSVSLCPHLFAMKWWDQMPWS